MNLAWWLSWLERRPVTAEVVGSSPIRVVFLFLQSGILAQLGEHLPYKQRVTGSSPVGSIFADMAQLAEQLICNQQVEGSSPPIGLADKLINKVLCLLDNIIMLCYNLTRR